MTKHARPPIPRPTPARIADRLIVALDLPTVEDARAMAARLDGPAGLPVTRAMPEAQGLFALTPGVRLAGAGLDDHKRTGTPAQPIADGADYLVVGRPIVQAADPAAMAAQIIADMASAG